MGAPKRALQVIIAFVIALAAIALLVDSSLPVGIGLAGVALMLACWRFKLPY